MRHMEFVNTQCDACWKCGCLGQPLVTSADVVSLVVLRFGIKIQIITRVGLEPSSIQSM